MSLSLSLSLARSLLALSGCLCYRYPARDGGGHQGSPLTNTVFLSSRRAASWALNEPLPRRLERVAFARLFGAFLIKYSESGAGPKCFWALRSPGLPQSPMSQVVRRRAPGRDCQQGNSGTCSLKTRFEFRSNVKRNDHTLHVYICGRLVRSRA